MCASPLIKDNDKVSICMMDITRGIVREKEQAVGGARPLCITS